MRELSNHMPQAGPHCSPASLLDYLYGLDSAGSQTAAHLAGCPQCAARLDELKRQRAALAQAPAVSDEFLRQQRLAIHSRLQQQSWSAGWRVAPLALTGLVVALGLWLQQPAPPARPVHTAAAVSDSQFFEEVSLALSRPGVRGADPLQALFVDEVQP